MALAGSFSVVYQLPEPKLAVQASVACTVTRTAMVEEWCSFDLTKNTTTASTSQRVLNGMALAGSFSVVYQLPEPKLAVLESVGGL
jgi:hypothetical protein